MAIKPTGRGVPVAPATEIGGTEKTATAGRKFAVGDTAEVASSGPADVGAMEQAVADVAQRVRTGELPSHEERVDAVIENIVRAQAPDGAPATTVRDRVLEAQLVLGDDPVFSAQIRTLLTRALDE